MSLTAPHDIDKADARYHSLAIALTPLGPAAE